MCNRTAADADAAVLVWSCRHQGWGSIEVPSEHDLLDFTVTITFVSGWSGRTHSFVSAMPQDGHDGMIRCMK